MTLTVNGEATTVPTPSNVEDLLRRLRIDARQVAVERNRTLVRKTDYAATLLVAGDVLEIVSFVGGG
ncbi:MAG: sulfur carrier protein ThiS [Planctomycetota bacterium]